MEGTSIFRKEPIICNHNRQYHMCKVCGTGGICIHNDLKSDCQKCNGGKIVEYDDFDETDDEFDKDDFFKKIDQKWNTKSTCIHNRYRYYCINCGGAGICIHKKRRYDCRICNPDIVCCHEKIKKYCSECKIMKKFSKRTGSKMKPLKKLN